MMHAAYGRSFFITKKGCMGLAPSLTSMGDKVVILPRGRTPYTLHKKKSGVYRFVGEAYVRGIMAGELVTGLGTATQMVIE